MWHTVAARRGGRSCRQPWTVDRRRFLAASAGAAGAAVFGRLPLTRLAAQAAPPPAQGWDAGRVRHLLPAVSDSRLLLKASFTEPLAAAPTLRVGDAAVTGRMTDTAGQHWQFYATGLDAARRYTLSLAAAEGRALCEPWPLSTFPAPAARPQRFRLLCFTCAGGPGGTYTGIGVRSGFLPTAIRNRLLRRALAFEPDAAVANGDHIYWDLHVWQGDGAGELSAAGRRSNFDFSASILGAANEAALKAAAGAQIVPVYGTDFRSTPVFFLQDDHDHWENDAVTDAIANFPIPWFQLQLARATQHLYYPEFLPDAQRPAGLPWSAAGDRGDLSRELRHAALRGTGGSAAVRRAAHGQPGRAERGLRRSPGGALAAGANARDGGAAPRTRAVQPVRLERRQVGRVVSGRARPRHGAS